MRNKLSLQISPAVCILWALMLLILPFGWLVSCLAAAAFHELCHIAAVKACGGRITELEIGATGARLQADSMTGWKTLLCTLAGPVGGLLPVLTARWFPRLALCTLVHSAYNLLPILPLDGGKALCCMLEFILPGKKGENVCRFIGQACSGLILLSGMLAALAWNLGLMPLLPGILLLSTAAKRKRPCKPGF